jgi:mono/diheme cytochrome c family protein/peroxiredoxin
MGRVLGLLLGAVAVVGVSMGLTIAWRTRGTSVPAHGIAKAPPNTARADGRLLYEQLCQACHGATGKGDGTSAAAQIPPPGDFTDGQWKHGKTFEEIRRVIRQGVPGTAMPATPTLSADELDAVTHYVLELASRRSALPAEWQRRLHAAGFQPLPPAPAPALSVRGLQERERTLADFAGRPLVVHFWSSQCVHCLAELPALEQLAESRPEVTVLSVCHDLSEPEPAAALAARHAPRLPVQVDPTGLAALHYDVAVLPATYLVDPAGQLFARAQGKLDWSSPALRELLRSLLPLN